MSQSTGQYPVPAGAKQLARRAANGVLAALIPLLIAQILVDAVNIDVGATGPMSPFAAGPLVGVTVAAGAGAAVAYALAVRFTARPVRTFVGIAAIAFVLMTIPVFAVPPEGITPVGQGILLVYHLIVAIPMVVFITGRIEM